MCRTLTERVPRRWVLTAASCVGDEEAMVNLHRVVLGGVNMVFPAPYAHAWFLSLTQTHTSSPPLTLSLSPDHKPYSPQPWDLFVDELRF